MLLLDDTEMTIREGSRCTKLDGSSSCCLSNGGRNFSYFQEAFSRLYFCQVGVNYISFFFFLFFFFLFFFFVFLQFKI